MDSFPSARAASFRRHSWVALTSVALLLGGGTAWAALTEISAAVLAPGIIAVEGGSKRVQHPEGGIVKSIFVENGQLVAAGELLIELDDTALAATLTIVEDQLADGLGLEARLQAESTGAVVVTPQPDILEPKAPRFAMALTAQQKLLATRAATQRGISARLEEQVAQIQRQVMGLEAQKAAVEEQVIISSEELVSVEELLAGGLIESSRATAIKRELSRLKGEAGRIAAEIAAAEASISERKLQIVQASQEFQTSVLEELQETSLKVAELRQQKVAAEDRLARLGIRAPQAGIVHESAVRTVGGVISAGETLMWIVPQADRILTQTRISPLDVDKAWVGQSARLRLSGLNSRETPELVGKVATISPDLEMDSKSGVQFYSVRITVSKDELSRLPSDVTLIPGMPVEAFLQAEDRTVLSYLMQPVADQLRHAFREAD